MVGESLPWKARTRTCLCYMTRIPRGFGMPATPDRRTPPPSLPRQVNSGVRCYRNLSSSAPLVTPPSPPAPTFRPNLPELASTFDAFDRHHRRYSCLYSRRFLQRECARRVCRWTDHNTCAHTTFESSGILREASVERTVTLLLT